MKSGTEVTISWACWIGGLNGNVTRQNTVLRSQVRCTKDG